MISGKDLINMGYSPSKWFSKALSYLNSNLLSDSETKNYLDSLNPKQETFSLLDSPVYFHKNIVAETPEEEDNIVSVTNVMSNLMKTPTAINGAIMPDACPTSKEEIPVGGIIVTKNAIHPAFHSADICCSMMATDFGFVDPKIILDAAHQQTHFGAGGRSDNKFSLPKELETKCRNNSFLSSQKSLFLAQSHLGTQGDGNHFLFVGKSINSGRTIMVTHHGSRGFGANLYKEGMIKAEIFRKLIGPSVPKKSAWIPYDTIEGKQYWEALQIVREWTKYNHSVIHDAVLSSCSLLSSVKVEVLDRFWNEHNFVFKKDDDFYHAKGSTPLTQEFVPDSTNGLRLIPLNMSEPILVVRGESSVNNLGFAPHGAGRNTSRTAHKKKIEHKTVQEVFNEETSGLDIRFFSGSIDTSELPSAYKNASSVKKQIEQFGLGEIVDEIYPYGCIMAGSQNVNWKEKRRKRRS